MGIAAAIDIGSNSVRLLIARIGVDSMEPLHKELRTTKLGAGIDAKKVLCPQSMEKTLAAVKELKTIALSIGAEEVTAFATNAVRDAANGDEFVEKVRKLSLNISVLSGEQEADIGFIGAVSGLGGVKGRLFVADIGGGSTELAAGEGFNIKKRKSLDIGSVRMTERFIKNDPIKRDEMEDIKGCIADTITRDAKKITDGNAVMIGIGGTISSIAAIATGMEHYDRDIIHGLTLTGAEVRETLQKISALNAKKRKNIPGLLPGRADIIVAGGIILSVLMDYWGFDALTVSEWDSLEGFLYRRFISPGKCQPRKQRRHNQQKTPGS